MPGSNAILRAAGYSMIGDVIDFSCEQEGMLVQQGVCQELDDLKATYHALPDYLTQVRGSAQHCQRRSRCAVCSMGTVLKTVPSGFGCVISPACCAEAGMSVSTLFCTRHQYESTP